MQKFNVGDKVKITAEGIETGWPYVMYYTIGMAGIVLAYNHEYNGYNIKVDGTNWWYKPDSLELVEPVAKPQVATNDTIQELLTIEQAVHLLKSNGYKVYKEM